jgi:hypothetical protein
MKILLPIKSLNSLKSLQNIRIMSLLGLYLAEDGNMLDRSVLTDAELDGVIGEAGELDPTDPQRQQFVARVNKGTKNSQAVIPTDDLRIRAA